MKGMPTGICLWLNNHVSANQTIVWKRIALAGAIPYGSKRVNKLRKIVQPEQMTTWDSIFRLFKLPIVKFHAPTDKYIENNTILYLEDLQLEP